MGAADCGVRPTPAMAFAKELTAALELKTVRLLKAPKSSCSNLIGMPGTLFGVCASRLLITARSVTGMVGTVEKFAGSMKRTSLLVNKKEPAGMPREFARAEAWAGMTPDCTTW